MNIFNLRDHVINDYHQYVESFLNIQDEKIRAFVSVETYPGSKRKRNPAIRGIPHPTVGVGGVGKNASRLDFRIIDFAP